MNHICIAHFNQPLDWIRKLNTDAVAVIYTTGQGTFEPVEIEKHYCKNKGMDAGMYLSYIIDHYDTLPERILFCHHHETNWTQDKSLSEIINSLNWEAADYFNIGARAMYINPFKLISQEHIDIIKANWHIFAGHIEYTEELMMYCGTQFCVHQDLIKQYEKEFYVKLRYWVYNTELSDYFSGRMFEYFWHYLLTHDPIDRDIKFIV